jgi:flagella basal body P-ring formation protein FlgA
MMLTMRAKASDGGARGDTISITNPQSKKALQAVIVGPGRVSVNAAPTGRLAVAQP